MKTKEVFTVKSLPQISEAEFEVMKIVWEHAPISTNEITEYLVKTTTWSPKTIQTLIKRLVTKGALTYEKQSRVFVYTPLVGEAEYINQESNTFLKRFYNGNISSCLYLLSLGLVFSLCPGFHRYFGLGSFCILHFL